MLVSLLKLVRSFDDEEGLPEMAYDATCELISAVLGTNACKEFGNHIDATDGRFYLKTAVDIDRLIGRMMVIGKMA